MTLWHLQSSGVSAASEGADAPVSWQMPGVRGWYPVGRGHLFVGTYKVLSGDRYLEESLRGGLRTVGWGKSPLIQRNWVSAINITLSIP